MCGVSESAGMCSGVSSISSNQGDFLIASGSVVSDRIKVFFDFFSRSELGVKALARSRVSIWPGCFWALRYVSLRDGR